MSDTAIKIPAELFALAESSRFSGKLDLPHLAIGPDDYRFSDELDWQIDVTNTGSALLVAGTVEGTGTCACSRCLEDVAHDFRGTIEGYILIGVPTDAAGEFDDDEVGEDEFDVLPADHVIDVEPLIRAALIVDAPQVPLCRSDCAGLCPLCGANLNEGECGCEGDELLEQFNREANPFAALADLDL